MSTVTVIVGIIALLGGLVIYAFTSQAIQQKQEQRKRLLAALKNQARSFKFMLSGCPDGFLPKELKVLVQRSIIEVCEQLSQLEPKDANYAQDLKLFSAQMAETQRMPPKQQQAPLASLQQIKEVKMSLEELHRFVFNLEGRNRLTRAQGDTFRNQIKQLVLQVTVDSYVLNGQQAKQNDKIKLAAHYFDLAIKLLIREGKAGSYEARVSQLKSVLAELLDQLEDQPELAKPEDENEAEREEEWNQFASKDGDIWKKKQIYD